MSFRTGIASLPPLNPTGLRECQIKAITKLEASLKADRPRALVQMATGSGKTFTAITEVYRLLKHAGAERVLFLVDTRNLGEQAEQEFMAFLPNDDNLKFTELYNVQRLKSPSIADDVQVVISTIQRMYATLKGEEFDDALEEEHTPRSVGGTPGSRFPSSTTRPCRPSTSMSSSSTSATARSTTCGVRSSSTSMPT